MSIGCASTVVGWLVVRPAKFLTCLLIDIICRLVGVKKVRSVSAHPSVESKQFLISLKIGRITQKKVTVRKRIVAMILRAMGITENAEYGNELVVLSINPWKTPAGEEGSYVFPHILALDTTVCVRWAITWRIASWRWACSIMSSRCSSV